MENSSPAHPALQPASNIAAPGSPITSWSRGLGAEALGNLAHELRTPLQVVMGLLEILQDDAEQRAGAPREILERISANVFDLGQTLDNLMALMLAEAGGGRAIEENVTVASILADVGPAIEAANARKHLQLSIDIKDSPPLIRAPRRALTSTILNLATNAIKFTEAGAVKLVIRQITAGGGQAIEIAVSDTGPGLNPSEFDQASRPFAQLSQSSTRRHRGVGLGLAIVQRNVARLGGTLELQSTLGEGATFFVRFPIKEAVVPAAPPVARRGVAQLRPGVLPGAAMSKKPQPTIAR